MSLPDVHLADEAVAAFVDDALSPAACHRAQRHLGACRECRSVVEAQREAKVLLAAAPDPELPIGLLARLRDIPMTADFGAGDDIVLALDGDQLAWARAANAPGDGLRLTAAAPHVPVVPSAAARPATSPGAAAPSPDVARGPGRGPWSTRRRPASYSSTLPSRRLRRRSLAGALAGLAFGVIASAASTTGGATALTTGQVGPGGSPAPAVGPASPTTPLVNTLRVTVDDRRQANLLVASHPGR